MPRCTLNRIGLLVAFFAIASAGSAAESTLDEALKKLHAESDKLYSEGKHADAAKMLERALPQVEKAAGKDSTRAAHVARALGVHQRTLAQFDKAEPNLRRALEVYEKQLGTRDLEVGYALNHLGLLYTAKGDFSKAELHYRTAMPIFEDKLGKDNEFIGTVALNLAQAYSRLKEYAKAEPVLLRALAIYETKNGKDHLNVAWTCYELAYLYHEGLYQYAKAEPLYQRSLAIRTRQLAADHNLLLTTTNSLGWLYYHTARYKLAEPLWQTCLAQKRKKLGEEQLEVADCHANLGLLYSAWGYPAYAVGPYQKAVEIREKKLGKEHYSVGSTLIDLGTAFRNLGQPGRAEPVFRRCLEIYQKIYKPDHTQIATAMAHLGMTYKDMGQYAKAEPLYRKSLEMYEKALGAQHVWVGTSLDNLGELCKLMERFEEAEDFYKRGLQIRERQLGREHLQVALSLTNLGGLYQSMSEYPRAEACFSRECTIREKLQGKTHPDLANALITLALLNRSMGKHSQGERYARRAVEIAESQVGAESQLAAKGLNALGMIYLDLGLYAKAEASAKKSIQIYEKLLHKNHYLIGVGLNNLALIYQRTGRDALAEPLLKRCVEMYETTLGKEHVMVATPVNNLATLYLKTRDFARAEEYFKRALAIWEARQGHKSANAALVLSNLATLYRDQGQYDKADPLYRQCLEIYELRLGKDHPDVGRTTHALGLMSVYRGKDDQAIAHFDRARRVFRAYGGRVLPALPEREQLTVLATITQHDFHVALSHALKMKDRAAVCERTAGWLVNGKSLTGEALASPVLLARDSGDPQLQRYAAQLYSLRQELARLTMLTPAKEQQKAHFDRLEALKLQEQKLARSCTMVRGGLNPGVWIEASDVRAALPGNSVFIDVVRFSPDNLKKEDSRARSPRYAAWITPEKGDVKVVDLGPSFLIDSAARVLRQALEQSAKLIREKGEAEAEKQLRVPLARLSKLLIAPLLPHAGDSARWVVSPDGNLWTVPWEMLLLPDGKYAVEKHAFSYVLSGRDLVAVSPFKGKPAAPVIVADPEYTADATGGVRQPAPMDGTTVRGLDGLLNLGRIPQLPGTRAEAKAVEKSLADYTRQRPVVHLGRGARETELRKLRNPRVLVLSTHGFFLTPPEKKAGPVVAVENPLLRCGLLLAGCNDQKPGANNDDGVLTGLEVVGMDLRGTELVVLSACETGVGEVRGGEGVAGLRQAFRLAGAEAVISTLWQVPDQASAELMTRFFGGLAKGKDRASALREAQLKLIEGRRDEYASAHPFFWAAFTLTGR